MVLSFHVIPVSRSAALPRNECSVSFRFVDIRVLMLIMPTDCLCLQLISLNSSQLLEC